MFQGFTPQTIDFLWGIRMNNNREWFTAHKAQYTRELYEPMKALGQELFRPFADRSGDILKVSVDVSNSGSVAGKESVLVYSSDLVASLMPDVKRLRAFTKVELAPGETRSVTLEIPARSLAFVGTDLKWRLEEGDFRISVGGLSTLVRCSCTDIWD